MTRKKYLKESIKVGGRDLTVETGKVAKQADGSVVIQYGERAQVVEERNGYVLPGGSLVRDIDRLFGINNYASIRLPDDPTDSNGPFFRADAFEHFLDLLRRRGVNGPAGKQPAVNLGGLALRGSIGNGYEVVVRGLP